MVEHPLLLLDLEYCSITSYRDGLQLLSPTGVTLAVWQLSTDILPLELPTTTHHLARTLLAVRPPTLLVLLSCSGSPCAVRQALSSTLQHLQLFKVRLGLLLLLEQEVDILLPPAEMAFTVRVEEVFEWRKWISLASSLV